MRFVLTLIILLMAFVAVCHVVLNKENVRGAIGWVAVILFVPVAGSIAYALFGVNRIKRKAKRVRANRRRYLRAGAIADDVEIDIHPEDERIDRRLWQLRWLMDKITDRQLLSGNAVEPLVDGEQAYPAMLEAIRAARSSVTLCSYIFDNDDVGRRFVEVLADAVARGVEVRVMVDSVGARYSWPTIIRKLNKAGIPNTLFLPTRVPTRFMYINLRSHRKILVVDGTVGFTGGMNIRKGHMAQTQKRRSVRDVHFRLTGPIVSQLQEVFAEDWTFMTGEALEGPLWFPKIGCGGEVLARGISDGPDEDHDRLYFALLSAVHSARERIQLATPYFVPEESLLLALEIAAMRGVKVQIALPEKNNLLVVKWASEALYRRLIEHGIELRLTPGTFDHSKLMVVDDGWTLLGSGNWDSRSLLLNFEFNVECYDPQLAAKVSAIFNEKIKATVPLTPATLDSYSLLRRVRNGFARLAAPYL